MRTALPQVHLLTGWRDADEEYVVNVVVENVTDADRESTAVRSMHAVYARAWNLHMRMHAACCMLHAACSMQYVHAIYMWSRPRCACTCTYMRTISLYIHIHMYARAQVMAAIGAVFCSGTRSPY